MSTPSHVEVIEVVFVSTSRGDDTPGNPGRAVYQYWSKDGRLLADHDTLFGCAERSSYYAVERLMQVRGEGTPSASEHKGMAQAFVEASVRQAPCVRPGSLPTAYVDAELRSVTPVDLGRGRIGVSLDVPGCGPLRLALSCESAASLAQLIGGYLARNGGSHA